MAAVAAGTYLMIEKKGRFAKDNKARMAFLCRFVRAVCCGNKHFGQIGIDGVESNLEPLSVRVFVLVMAWLVVLVTRSGKNIKYVPLKELIFILLSGLAKRERPGCAISRRLKTVPQASSYLLTS